MPKLDELMQNPKFKKGFYAGLKQKSATDSNDILFDAEFDEDMHPRDESGKFTSGGGGSSSSEKGSGEKGEKEKKGKGGKKEEKYEKAMGEISKEDFNRVSEHIAEAEKAAKMYGERIATHNESHDFTSRMLQNEMIEAKEYKNVLSDLGYKAGEDKEQYQPAEWDRDHAYEKLKQLADFSKELDNIGKGLSAGTNRDILDNARESVRAHMSARLRAINDLGLKSDYDDWKESYGYKDVTGYDDHTMALQAKMNANRDAYREYAKQQNK